MRAWTQQLHKCGVGREKYHVMLLLPVLDHEGTMGGGGTDFRSSFGMEPSLVGDAFLPHHPNFAEFRMTTSGHVRLVLLPSWSGVNILHRI
jgi:hypothetical protein